MKRRGDEDTFNRGAKEAIWLLQGKTLSAPVIMDRWEVSRATAKRDLLRLELLFPTLHNARGERSLPMQRESILARHIDLERQARA